MLIEVKELEIVVETGSNRRLLTLLLSILLCWGLLACGQSPNQSTKPSTVVGRQAAIAETPPPKVLRSLQSQLTAYQPQVQIVTPAGGAVLDQTQVEVTLQVQDLPIFQDEELQLGPHLQVIVDEHPPVSVYSLDDPIIFTDLTAGTHLLRVFAVSPWGESFKNDGAYAQTQFSVLSRDRHYNPDPTLPLLTYNSPQGRYGSEPLLLDFVLHNAPLHWEAADTETMLNDWRVRVTVNGQSFVLDEWQSIYLEGFTPGLNWVELEFLDAQGQPLDNVVNNTVGIVDYQPDQDTPLSHLLQGLIPESIRSAIVDQQYRDRLQAEIEREESATVEPEIVTPEAFSGTEPEEPTSTVEAKEKADEPEVQSTEADEAGVSPATDEMSDAASSVDEAIAPSLIQPLELDNQVDPGDQETAAEEPTNTDSESSALEDLASEVPTSEVSTSAELEMPLILDEAGEPVTLPQEASSLVKSPATVEEEETPDESEAIAPLDETIGPDTSEDSDTANNETLEPVELFGGKELTPESAAPTAENTTLAADSGQPDSATAESVEPLSSEKSTPEFAPPPAENISPTVE